MMEIVFGIYKITNPNGRVYIGQSINCHSREKYYRQSKKGNSQYLLFRSIIKYGWGAHKFEVIHQCKEEALNELEIYYINMFESTNPEKGMNIRMGGNGGGKLGETTKEKLRQYKGEATSFYGRKHTEETINRMKEIKKGTKPMPHVLKACILANKGIKRSNKFRQHLSKIQKGIKKHSFPGSTRVVPVIAIKDTVIIEFDSIFEAATYFNGSRNGIFSSLKKGHQYRGFRFYYYDEEKEKNQPWFIKQKVKEEKKIQAEKENKEKKRLASIARSTRMKGHIVSEDTRRKLSLAHKGKVRSEYHRKRMGEVRKGKIGKDHNRSLPTIQYDLNGNKIKEWESMNIAAINLGFHSSAISKVCNGTQKKHKNFIWKYKKDVA